MRAERMEKGGERGREKKDWKGGAREDDTKERGKENK